MKNRLRTITLFVLLIGYLSASTDILLYHHYCSTSHSGQSNLFTEAACGHCGDIMKAESDVTCCQHAQHDHHEHPVFSDNCCEDETLNLRSIFTSINDKAKILLPDAHVVSHQSLLYHPADVACQQVFAFSETEPRPKEILRLYSVLLI